MGTQDETTGPSNPIGVLLVEDEPSVRLLLKRWVECSFDAEVWEASDGLQAIERISEGGVELIISDLNMPVLNGIEMLRLLQADPARDRMEVVIASEVANQDSVREAIELGVSDYLLKPLQYDWVTPRLQAAADRILARRSRFSDVNDDGLTRVLVADADPNYCQFAESTLSTGFTVVTARTVAEVLVKTMRTKPDVILLGENLPGLRTDFLLERVRTLPGANAPTVYELVSERDEPSSDGFEGVVRRSFVPENLRADLTSLLQGDAVPARGLLSWIGGVIPEVDTALYQALGMLTGEEPKTAEPPEPGAAELFGQIAIESDEGEFALVLRLDCELPFASALMATMLGEDPDAVEQPAPEEVQLDSVQEILNVVAGRIKNSCLERQVPVTIGLPQVECEAPPEQEMPPGSVEKYFSWREKHIFRFALIVAAKTKQEEEVVAV